MDNKPVVREYSGLTDDKMLSGSDLMKQLYIADVADFTAFDADFTIATSDEWTEVTAAARDLPTDETVMDQITGFTATMNDKWDDCKNYFQDAKFFIEKAFPGNKPVHNEFGFDNYEEMSRTQDKVIGFMTQFHAAAAKYSAQLIAKNFTQLKINGIETVTAAYVTAQNAQESAISARGTKTQERITALNAVWSFVKLVNKASKSVYRNDFAKKQQYLLPAAGTNEQAEDLALTGIATNSVTGAPLAGITVELPDLGLTAISDETGAYGFAAGTPAGVTAITAHGTGVADFEDTVTLVDGTTVIKNIAMVPG